jgi:trigger factor
VEELAAEGTEHRQLAGHTPHGSVARGNLMSDTATGVEFDYPATIEDIGSSTKKVTIEIPADRISAKISESYRDLRDKAMLPGFRPGRAPQKLIEKRYGEDVRRDVRDQLLGESYRQVIETNKLEVVGEPDFEKPDDIVLPASGSLKYTFQIEVRPTFDLPSLQGIAVKKPKIEVTEEHISQAMDNLREQQGTLVPVENRGVESKDRVVADITILLDGNQIARQEDARFAVLPGRIAGIFVADIDTQLAGMKPGESRQLTVKAPADHASENIRGKDVQIGIVLKDVKRLELAEVNKDFLDSLGFKDEAELREALREQMDIRIKNDVRQNMRDQVVKYLMENTKFDLPAKLSALEEQRVIQRRASDLYVRGVPLNQIEANIEKIRAGAGEQAASELKAHFILDKIATMENLDVTEGELNGQVATAALQSGERPEKLRQRLAKDGTLQVMYARMRENKAADKLLEWAKVEEITAQEQPKQA